jgi:ketosteroid isomerase-like protein
MRSILLSLALVPSFDHAQPERNDLRKQMEALFGKLDKAVAAKDMKTLFAHFDGSFVWIDQNGNRADLAQFKKNISDWILAAEGIESKTRIKNVQLQTREAVVWTEQTLSWVAKGPDGKKTRMTSTTRWAETLAWKNGAWRITQSQELFQDEPWTFRTNG